MGALTNPESDLRQLLLRAAVIGVWPLLYGGGATVLAAPPITWLPAADEARLLLGVLLGAQATLAALTLAVMVFVLQGISARQDADARVSSEYLRQTRVHIIFWTSLGMVAVTGAVLLAEELGSRGAPVLSGWPGLPNLMLLGVAAFGANLLLSGHLFQRALRFVQPYRWRELRREVNERDVRNAVQVFVRRYRRANTNLEAGEPDLADMFPDPGEGSADEAIRTLLDDALKSMDERRHADLATALDSIKEIVTYAMEELQHAGLGCGPPGSQPEWPPLRELDANLYTFREEVIRRGTREHVRALRSLDYWLLSRGVQRRCGELFTVGLTGHGANYEIASEVGNSEFREVFGDPWLATRDALSDLGGADNVPYMKQIIRQQERLLSSAMHKERPPDFDALVTGFADMFGNIRQLWAFEIRPGPEDSSVQELEQLSRIAMMGLGGRAMTLAASGRLADQRPYADAARSEYVRLEQLTGDIARAITPGIDDTFSWSHWEMEGPSSHTVRAVYPERYPLTFFSVRLLELVTDPMPDLDLHGSAQHVLDWFTTNSEPLLQHVGTDPGTGIARRRELALDALRHAVRKDEATRDWDIVGRELNGNRISDFVAEVYASMFASNTIERLFAHADAFEYRATETGNHPELRRIHGLIAKDSLTDAPHRAFYRDLRLGENVEDEVFEQLGVAMDDSPVIRLPLDSATELLEAIDEALSQLTPRGLVLVLLAGDWTDVLGDLDRASPDGYEPSWSAGLADLGGADTSSRYRGHPIISDRTAGRRRLCIVEPKAWGCFVRAQVEGRRDLLVEIEPISAPRARELLNETPGHFADEPDEASKLRRLQTYVEFRAGDRIGFLVSDPSRARSVVGPDS